MLTIRRSEQRGHADHGWLNAYHTFSFDSYFDADFTRFSVLRVLNQDRVAPGKGFATHPHRDMEIVTYVLEGSLSHKDSMGNGSEIRPGEVQFMSAGTGVTHSEFNSSKSEPLHLLQMWVTPATKGTEPRYEQKNFDEELQGQMKLVVSPDGDDGSITIGQDAKLYAGRFDEGDTPELTIAENRCAWLHVAYGSLDVNGLSLSSGDGLAVPHERQLQLSVRDHSNLVVWELPL